MATPNRTKQVTSIASIVGDRHRLDGRTCVDANNRHWEITHRHSGCILKGKNNQGLIPYWTCYYVELPGLRLIEGTTDYTGMIDPVPTLLEELLRLSAKDGDLFRDTGQGLLWVSRVSKCGLSLEGYDDNHWLPMKSLSVLGFGKLTKLSSKQQRDARKLERLL